MHVRLPVQNRHRLEQAVAQVVLFPLPPKRIGDVPREPQLDRQTFQVGQLQRGGIVRAPILPSPLPCRLTGREHGRVGGPGLRQQRRHYGDRGILLVAADWKAKEPGHPSR